jgi:hypothetical protein
MADAMKVLTMRLFAPAFASKPSAHRLSVLTLGVALTLVAPSTPWAQGMGGLGGGPTPGRPSAATPKNEPEPPPLPAPDAVPGAKARAPAAPATHAAGDLQPTDALFDAINRGDIAAARDAINRGADMDGVNILGMTPMELSVDLGRNNISFMLLSMRGEDSGRGSRASGRSDVETKATRKSPTVVKAASTAKPPGRTRVPAAAAPEAPRPAPKLFANDGGTPLPSAGFLGFDAGSATN